MPTSKGPTGLASARPQARVSVLFAESLPATPESLAGWLEGLGLAELGFTVRNEQGVQLTSGRHTVHVLLGTGPMPREGLDLRQLPNLPREAGYLTLATGVSPGGEGERLARDESNPDPWAGDGWMRVLSMLVARLAHEGMAVVLHQAGSLVKDSSTFARLLRSLSHPDYRPFTAWVDVSRGAGSRQLRLRGMESFGLPDLQLAPEEWDTWETTRAREALYFAAYRMVRENRMLAVGEILEVPLGVQPGSWPESFDGDMVSYRVRASEHSSLVLERISDAAEPFTRWARASAPGKPSPSSVGLNTYQALFRHALEGALPGDTVAEMAPPASQGLPPHVVLIRTRLGTSGFTLVTNGFGRVPQPGGTRDSGSAHVELAAWMDSHGPERAMALSALGALMQSKEDAWAQGDIAVLSEPLLGLRHFLLAPGPVVPVPPGSPVNLLWVIPLHADEFEKVRRAGPLLWAHRLLKDPSRRTELRQRWSLGVH
ncbi:hypothetical protein [Myxococcus sp. RHSTA-1-4]|uniref:hypothetical protein n=1 Tax=Myxococcus sp. RHSTA-1-4 TaxID=2874601 RepID=UPI001CBD98F1|nr:hypothetical protein [Myxococcus sp. RHSTA-1-4]